MRIAVRLPRNDARAWQRRCVECVRAVPDARVVLAIGARMSIAPAPGADPGLAPVPFETIAGDAPRADDGDATAMRAHAVDIVLDLVGGGAAVDAPLGTWRYGFGDGRPSAGGAAGTCARLFRVTRDPDAGVVLHEGWYRSRTARASGTISVSMSVAPWCARIVRQIAGGDTRAIGAAAVRITDTRSPAPPAGRESWWRAEAGDALRGLFVRDRWTIGVMPRGIDALLDAGRLPEPAWLAHAPTDRYYADPFLLGRAGDHLRVLVEDYRYRERRGRLTELVITAGGHLLAAHERHVPAHHASYPFVFTDDERTWCVPEMAGVNRIDAFEIDAATGAFRAHGPVLDGFPGVDPTLVAWNDRWWLFCTSQRENSSTDLYVFSAKSWTGPWEPHPLNPVKSDARSSRPAGALFERAGTLYRPAQDCAARYGAGVVINRIVELSPRRFVEEPVARFAPAPTWPWPSGLHTINTAGAVTVVDALRSDRRFDRRPGRPGSRS